MGRAGGRWRALLVAAPIALLGIAGPAAAQDGEGSSTSTTVAPTSSTTVAADGPVSGPVAASVGTKGHPLTAAVEPIGDFGYQEDEVFLSGTATLHGAGGLWTSDGRWATTDVGEVPFRTRLLVRRPVDPAKFSGTVYVSWLNVNGAFDSDPDWSQLGAEIVREGAVWVGVSAQSLGIEGPLGAKAWDPARYGSLQLEAEGASYDVFTQAAHAVRSPGAVDPLGGLGAERRLIAIGQSQSAQRLVTYINAFQPRTKAFDGFLVLSRFRGAAPLGRTILPPAQAVDPDGSGDQPYLPDPLAALVSGPPLAKVRTDTSVPVFTVLTETESRQDRRVTSPDGSHSRTWEIAGATHLDDHATTTLEAKLRRDLPEVPLDQLQCARPNTLPTRYALRAALRALATWVDDGTLPPTAPPLDRDPSSGALLRDADGNAKGGLRLPEIEVPTARYSGESDATGYCGLTGSTVPFTQAQLDRRYPTPEAYVQELAAAVDDAVHAGHLLADDAAELLAATPVPGTKATAASIVADRAGSAGATAGSGADRSTAAGSPSSGSSGADAPATAQSSGSATRAHGWMATTGRDLITPFLAGLLLLLNGRVVLTIAAQRRRSGGG